MGTEPIASWHFTSPAQASRRLGPGRAGPAPEEPILSPQRRASQPGAHAALLGPQGTPARGTYASLPERG